MTDAWDASALDRILESGVGIPDGTGVTTEATLGTALGTVGTGVGKSEAAEDAKLPTSDVAAETQLDMSETNDEGMLGNGRTAVGVTSGVEMGSGAVSPAPVPVPATPEVGRNPPGVIIG